MYKKKKEMIAEDQYLNVSKEDQEIIKSNFDIYI